MADITWLTVFFPTPLIYRYHLPLKVHKHEIILNFFFYLNQNLICPWSISILFLRIFPEFQCSNIFAVTEHTRNQILLVSYKKNFSPKFSLWSYKMGSNFRLFFGQNLHFNLVFLSNFRKLKHAHAEHTGKRFYRTLSIRGDDFIAHWAYAERIFAYAQPAEKY